MSNKNGLDFFILINSLNMKTTCWMPTTWLRYYLFIEKDLVDLVEQSNKMFENLQRKTVIQKREKNYFKFNFKKATILGKLDPIKYIRA